MVKNNLNYKQYCIKKSLCKSYTDEQKHHQKALLEAEEKLKKQKIQNKKYQSLPEYEWLRQNKRLYDEQMRLEGSIASSISYYKQRLEKLPEEIKYEKAEMRRLKKIILAEDPSFDFNAPEKSEKRNFKKELEIRIEKLITYEDILNEKAKELENLKDKLDKIQSLSKKTKADQEKEREYIESISNVRFSMDRTNNMIVGCNMVIAGIVRDEYTQNKRKK